MAYLVKRKLRTGYRWYIRYRLPSPAPGKKGRMAWIAAGANRQRAIKMRDSIAGKLLEARTGILVSRSELTLRGFADTYLDRMEKLRPRSDAWRRYRMKQLLQRLGGVLLEDIEVGTLDRYAHERMDAGASSGTVNSDLAVLRHAIACAVRWREETGLQVNRLTGWRPIRGPVRAARFLDVEEVERIRLASAELDGPCHVFLELFFASGARPGELLRIEEDDVVGGTVRLPALKGGVERTVIVNDDLATRVRAVLKDWTHQKVRSHWRRVRAAAKLEGVRFYDIRHTVASTMLKRGATIRDVQRLLGHQSARMTERYAHFATNAPALKGLKW